MMIKRLLRQTYCWSDLPISTSCSEQSLFLQKTRNKLRYYKPNCASHKCIVGWDRRSSNHRFPLLLPPTTKGWCALRTLRIANPHGGVEGGHLLNIVKNMHTKIPGDRIQSMLICAASESLTPMDSFAGGLLATICCPMEAVTTTL